MVGALVGFLVVFPTALSLFLLGDSFAGVYPVRSNDELFYLTRAQESAEGHILISSPYLATHKEDGASFVWLPEYVLSRPAAWGLVSIPTLFVFYDFLLPALIATLICVVSFRVTGSRRLAAGAGLIFCVGLFIQALGRPVFPQFSLLLWLLFFGSFLEWVRSLNRKYFFICVLLFAALVYSYPYYWIHISILVFFCALFSLWRERHFLFFLACAGMGMLAALLALPYLYILLGLIHHPSYLESSIRWGGVRGYFPGSILVEALCVGILLFTFAAKRWFRFSFDKVGYALVLNVLAVAVAANQQLFTGVYAEFSSHYYSLAVLGSLFLFIYVVQKVKRYPLFVSHQFILKTLFTVLVVGISLWGILGMVKGERKVFASTVSLQQYGPILGWVEKNVKAGESVAAPQELARLIPAYTERDVLYADELKFTLLSEREFTERFALQFLGNSPTDDFFREHQTTLWGLSYTNGRARVISENKIRKIFGLSSKPLPDITAGQFAEARSVFDRMSAGNTVDLLHERGVSYVITSQGQSGEIFSKAAKVGKAVFTSNGFTIYRI